MKTIHLIYAANNKLIPHFPESSLSLAGILLDQGYRVEITDTEITPESEWSIENPLFFGITVYSNESISRALSVARHLRKKFPDVPIVWGGPHAQMRPEETASHPLVDAVCYGEGELTILEIARQLSQGEWRRDSIKGLVYQDADGRIVKNDKAELFKLDDLPFPPYHLLDLNRYAIAEQKMYYQSSRGCPFTCAFCSYTHKWRGKSAKKVLEDLQKLVQISGSREVYFSDGNFFVSRKRAQSICEGIISMNLGLKWTAFCRCDTLLKMDENLLKLLRRSGCYQLDIGGESGSNRILKYLSKGITKEMILCAVERLAAVGIRAELSFIAGVPAETEQDLYQTVSFIDTLRSRFPKNTSINGIFQYQPFPNSPLGKETIEQWALPIPKTLEEWARNPITIPRREYFPWLNNRRYSKVLMLSSIANYQFLYGRLVKSAESRALKGLWKFKILRLFAKVMHYGFLRYSTYFRLKLNWDRFPVEWAMYRIIRDKVLKMI